jgi:hypothetical protein
VRNLWENDDFSITSMTQTMEDLRIVPARIGQLGLFESEGVTTTTVALEKRAGELKLIPTAARGTMPTYKRETERTLRVFAIPHLPKNDAVIAESIQNVRGFGTDALEAFSNVVAQRLLALKKDHELTWEYHRIGALQGQVLDADGSSVVYDIHAEFGITRTSMNWDSTSVDGIRELAIELQDHMDDSMFGEPFTGIMVLCSEGFWAKLITAPEIKIAYAQYQSTMFFSKDQTVQPFQFAGLMFMRLNGRVGSVPFIPEDKAAAFPIGTSGLYKHYMAPAPFEETVNTIGLPYYARQEAMRFGTGREIHTNSNPLFICRRPAVLVEVTFSE